LPCRGMQKACMRTMRKKHVPGKLIAIIDICKVHYLEGGFVFCYLELKCEWPCIWGTVER